MGISLIFFHLNFKWELINLEESKQVVSLKSTEDCNCGQIMITRNSTLDPSGRSHSLAPLTHQASVLIKLLSRPSSQTPLSESVSEFSLRRTTRKSLHTCQEMVVWVSSMRTMKCSLPVSVDLVTPRVIFRVSDSRSLRPPVARSLPFG